MQIWVYNFWISNFETVLLIQIVFAAPLEPFVQGFDFALQHRGQSLSLRTMFQTFIMLDYRQDIITLCVGFPIVFARSALTFESAKLD